MIGYLKGKLIEKNNTHLLIDVNGVGYNVFISNSSSYEISNIGEDISLHIFTNVREDEIKLYGFLTKSERICFEKLTDVSGIGPKLAQNILSNVKAGDLVNLIEIGNFEELSRIPGIGKKTAQRLVIELKGKLIKYISEKPTRVEKPEYIKISEDVTSAMLNLGYSKNKAEDILSQIKYNESMKLEDIIKEVLRRIK